MKLIYSQDIVQFDKKAEKDLAKIPHQILKKLKMWVKLVNHQGIIMARKIPGYHDEPLAGDRKGQRSIRLNKAYRAIYIEEQNSVKIIVIEVNKHDY